MRIYREIKNFPTKNLVLTIGTFDGVHLGHKFMLKSLSSIAKNTNGETAVFTFYPHPREVLFPNETPPQMLSSLTEKAKLLEENGVEHLILFPFTADFSKLTAQLFVKEILHAQLNVNYLLLGHDHRFGSDRVSDLNLLSSYASEFNMSVSKAEVFKQKSQSISSSRIRKLILAGDVAKAESFLGYKYSFSGKVVAGHQVGRTIGFPTANIEISDFTKLLPLSGVYSVEVLVRHEKFKGMLNIGTKPTLESKIPNKTVEVHIFNFSRDIYNEMVSIKFVRYVRQETKFDSLVQLKNQLNLDMKLIKEEVSS